MTRFGMCRMCERTTEFREYVVHGSACLECIQCGDQISTVAFVELRMLATVGVTEMPPEPWVSPEKRAEVLAGIQGEIGALTAKIAAQHAQIRVHTSISTDGIRVDELAEAKARIHELTLLSEHLVERNNEKKARIEDLEGQLRTADHVANTISAARDIIAQRNNRLSDEAGSLHNERDDLLRENAVLRRRLETVERKAVR